MHLRHRESANMSLKCATNETDDSASLSPTVDCQVTEGPPLEMDDDHNELLFKLFSTADCSNADYIPRRTRGRPPGTKNPPADFMELRRKSGSYEQEEIDDGLLAKRGRRESEDVESGPIDVALMKKLGFMKTATKEKEFELLDPKVEPDEPVKSPRVEQNPLPRVQYRVRKPDETGVAPLLVAKKEPVVRVTVQPQAPRATIQRRVVHINGQNTKDCASSLHSSNANSSATKDQEPLITKANFLKAHTLNPVTDAIKKQSLPPSNFDEDTLLLYKRSLIAQIERDKAMRDYYRLKRARLEELR